MYKRPKRMRTSIMRWRLLSGTMVAMQHDWAWLLTFSDRGYFTVSVQRHWLSAGVHQASQGTGTANSFRYPYRRHGSDAPMISFCRGFLWP